MNEHHAMRIELALALGGHAVFCSCGKLTRFAVSIHDAALIHAAHVKRATERSQ
jgi:hypothetical protein